MTRLASGQLDALELACMDCGYELVDAPEIESMAQILKENPSALAIIDCQGFRDAVMAGTEIEMRQLILLAIERENLMIIDVMEKIKSLRYLVATSGPALLRGLVSSILEFHLSECIRGVFPRLVSLDNLVQKTMTVVNSSEKSKMQELISEFFNEELIRNKDKVVAGTSSFSKNLGDIADEFLMNAIWDANPLFENAERTTALELAEPDQVQIECSSDGMTFCLSVTDKHGSFPDSAMLKPLRFALGTREETKLNEGTGGAGIGLYMILQKAPVLLYEIEKGRTTKAIALLRLDQSFKDIQRKPKTVLFFTRD